MQNSYYKIYKYCENLKKKQPGCYLQNVFAITILGTVSFIDMLDQKEQPCDVFKD